MSDALSATSRALARRALLVLPADRPRGRADVARLPAPIGRLLAARLDRAVDAAAPSSPWIDHTDDRVREATANWVEAARAAVQFPVEDWESAVEDAASQALEHLVQPCATIAEAAVPEGPVSVEAAIARGRRFGAYPYLLEVAARYAQRKEIGQVDRQTFFQLLDRIDRRMVEPFGADEWINLFNPLFALVAPVGSPVGTIPAEVLKAAFQARGADEIASRLSGDLTEQDVRDRIEDDSVGAGAATEDAPEEVEAPTVDEPDVEARHIATEPPKLTPAPLPPIADDSIPSIIGSKYGRPELDGLDDSSVVGPPRPVSKPVADLEVDSAEDPEPPAPEQPAMDDAPPSADARPPSPLEQILRQASTSAEPKGGTPFKEEPLWKRLARQREERERGSAPTPEAPAPAASAPASEADVPLWKRFAQSDLANRLPPPETEDFVAETVDPEDVSVDDAEAFIGDQEDATFEDVPTDASDPGSRPGPALEDDTATPDLEDGAPADDLEVRVLGPDAGDRRSWYVAELFGGSAADYRSTLQSIDEVDSYTEATTVVSTNVLVKNSVSPFSDAAIAFIDAVQFQFENR
ncbi:hypothetical protein [Rubrivirga sp.]|uniref:hypothetical protein n=1 Tax=Rubrivirga sp. TaxID=1885344 RepID=UPI003C7671B0